MTSPSNDGDFLHELFRDAMSRIDAASDRFESKLDNLEKRVIEMQSSFQDQTSSRLSDMETRLQSHGEKLVKHEHTFSVITFIFTSGIAGMTALFSWFSGIFGSRPPH
jgi:uncharacterized protein YukE